MPNAAEVMGQASQQATSNDLLDEKRLRFSNTVIVIQVKVGGSKDYSEHYRFDAACLAR